MVANILPRTNVIRLIAVRAWPRTEEMITTNVNLKGKKNRLPAFAQII
jgi:hypothetical protein